MAVYKVLQDIESEDKLLGPLTLKGFIYAAISGVLIFLTIRIGISSASALIKIIFIIIFLPPTLLFGVLASPLGREQPTEVWLLARINYLLKSHQRTWDQSGIKELVKITAPKLVQQVFTKNLSKTEVDSRLQALANTLDSRGWAVKNSAINLSSVQTEGIEENSERLSSAATIAPTESFTDIHDADDILDEENNAAAQKMKELVDKAETDRKNALFLKMEEARSKAATQPTKAATPKPAVNPNALTEEEKRLLQKVHQEQSELVLHPPKIIKGSVRTEVMTPMGQTVKLELAQSGNDLSVASIARLANNSPAI